MGTMLGPCFWKKPSSQFGFASLGFAVSSCESCPTVGWFGTEKEQNHSVSRMPLASLFPDTLHRLLGINPPKRGAQFQGICKPRGVCCADRLLQLLPNATQTYVTKPVDSLRNSHSRVLGSMLKRPATKASALSHQPTNPGGSSMLANVATASGKGTS